MENNEDDYIFSEELREKLSKFSSMNISDALQSKEFLTALCEYGGLDKETIDDVFKEEKD